MIAWLRKGFSENTWWSRLLFAGLQPVMSLVYHLCNKLADLNGRHIILQFSIDDWIPFNKWFILPYFLWYLQIALTVGLLVFSPRAGRLLHRMVVAMSTAVLIAAIFYLFMPTMMIRPVVEGADLLSRMVLWIYTIDLPFNCFPSMHVFWSAIVARYLALALPRKFWIMAMNYGSAALIIISTVFTKQHYTPDILGGLAVAYLSCKLSDRLLARWIPVRST